MKHTHFYLCVVLFANIGILSAETYSGSCGPDLTWSLNTEDSTLVIEGAGQMDNFEDWGSTITPWWRYASNIAYVSLPEELTSIGNRAFEKCSKIREINIPNKVTHIGGYAFYECSSLESIINGKAISYIYQNAFCKCTNLKAVDLSNVTDLAWNAFNYCSQLRSVILGNNLIHIGENAFSYCTSLSTIELPNSLISMDAGVFAQSGLTQITIPDKVEDLWIGLFQNCTELETVHIGAGVKSIQSACFAGCTSLKELFLPDNVTEIANDAFFDLTSLTSPIANSHIFVRMPLSYQGAYTIQDGIQTILDNAFLECTDITEVTIPTSVTSIGESAFQNCRKLQSISIPEGVLELKNNCFAGCTNLAQVSLPNSLQSLGEGAFSECYSLRELTIPENLYAIGQGAFWGSEISTIHWNATYCGCVFDYNGCTMNYSFPLHDLADKLETVTFGANVQYIPEQMLYDQHVLRSVELPESLTHIGEFAFAYCDLLESLDIPASVTEIGRDAFDGCSEMKNINVAQENENYSSIDGVLFDKSATTLLYFPGGREGEYTIPNGTKTIGQMAFDKTRLFSVTIPESVEMLMMYAFAFSKNLSEIHFLSPIPPTIEMYAFDNDYWSGYNPYKYYVPCGTGPAYAQAIEEAMQYQPMFQAPIKEDCDYVMITDFHYEYEIVNCAYNVTFYNDSYVAIRDKETGELSPSSIELGGFWWNLGGYPYEYIYESTPTAIFPAGSVPIITMTVYYDEDLYDTATRMIELPYLEPSDSVIDAYIAQGKTYSWNNGFEILEISEEGEYVGYLVNQFGCDSIVTLQLHVLQDADHVDITSEEVVVVPTEDEAVIIWPQVEGAYTLDIC